MRIHSDIIDSRDLATELDELEDRALDDDIDPLDEDETARLAALREFAEVVGDEWQHGEALIPEEDFVSYAQQLADDLGMVNSDAPWPLTHIDWQAAADELRSDYDEHEFDGVTYLFRA